MLHSNLNISSTILKKPYISLSATNSFKLWTEYLFHSIHIAWKLSFYQRFGANVWAKCMMKLWFLVRFDGIYRTWNADNYHCIASKWTFFVRHHSLLRLHCFTLDAFGVKTPSYRFGMHSSLYRFGCLRIQPSSIAVAVYLFAFACCKLENEEQRILLSIWLNVYMSVHETNEKK